MAQNEVDDLKSHSKVHYIVSLSYGSWRFLSISQLTQSPASLHAVILVVFVVDPVNGDGVREGVPGGTLSSVTDIAQFESNLPSFPQFRHDDEHRKISQPGCGVPSVRVADGKVHKPRRLHHKRTVVRVERHLAKLALFLDLSVS